MHEKKVTSNAVTYIGFEAVNKSLPFVLTIILVNFLTPSDIGIIAQFNALLGLLSVFIGLSVHGAVSASFFRLSDTELREYIFNALFILLSTTLLFIVLQFILYRYWSYLFDISQQLFISAGLCAAFGFVTSLNLVLWQSEMKPVKYGVYQILLSLSIFLSSVLLVVVLNYGWEGRIFSQVASVIIFGLISLGILKYRNYVVAKFNLNHIKHAIKFGLPLIPHSLLSWIFMGFNIMLISEVLGKESAGIFSVAMQMAMILSVVYASINRAVQPIAFKMIAGFGDNPETIGEYKSLSYKVVILNLSIGFASLLVLSELLIMLFPSAYHGVVPVLNILIFAEIINSVYYVFVKTIFFNNKTHYLLISSGFASIVHLVLSYSLVEVYLEYSVAISQLISYAIMLGLVYVFSQKIYYIKWL